jgi:hypothetical protein
MKCKEKPLNFPSFYWQVLQNWYEVKEITQTPTTVEDIRKETLWLNKDIKINKKELRWKQWYDSGILIIHDIVNEIGIFLTKAQIEQKYDVTCDTLQYNALKNAISQDWRRIIKTIKIDNDTFERNEPISIKIGKQIKRIKKVTNKEIYWILVKNIQEDPIILTKMQQNMSLTKRQCKDIFKIPRLIKNTKIITFQYKVLYNLVPCNLYLNRITKSDTNKCNVCQQLDDIMHYLYECEDLRTFWNTFNRWWKNFEGDNIILNGKMIWAGVLDDNIKINEILNICIIIAKWHIYKCKLNEKQPFFYRFLCELKQNIVIEKTIALKNNNITKYIKKWQPMEDYLM